LNIIPVTVRLFGISLTFVIPGSKFIVFLYGILFWAVMGPVIKWVCKEIIKNLGAILGGHYVQKNEYAGYERSPSHSN
jgi:hypothetical protein